MYVYIYIYSICIYWSLQLPRDRILSQGANHSDSCGPESSTSCQSITKLQDLFPFCRIRKCRMHIIFDDYTLTGITHTPLCPCEIWISFSSLSLSVC